MSSHVSRTSARAAPKRTLVGTEIATARRAVTLAASALFTLTALTAVSAHAQSAANGGATPAAAARAAQSLHIPAGSLQQGLVAFAQQTGLMISYDAAQIADKRTAGVSGTYTPSLALAILIEGTGLQASGQPNGGYIVAPGPNTGVGSAAGAAGAAVVLPQTNVNARAERDVARGPVVGYVAQRSDTATKSDTSIMTTSQSISVIPRDQMNDQAVQTVTDALKYAAGVNADPYGSDTRADWFYIRGFNADVYWDGLRVPQIANRPGSYAAIRVDPYTLERVEVLRGPSSILYGAGNLGGLVNLVSKAPSTEPYREIGVDYGTFDRRQLRVDMTGPANEDGTLLYRITGLGRLSNAQTDNVSDDRIMIQPSITWRPNAQTSFTWFFNYMQDSMGSSVSYGPALGMVNPSRWGRIDRDLLTGDPAFDRYRKTQVATGYRFEHRVNDALQLRSTARFTHMDLDYKSIYGTALLADQRTLQRTAYQAAPILNGWQLDNNVQYDTKTGPVAHKVVGGVDFQTQRFLNRVWTGTAPSLDLYAPVYGVKGVLPANPTTSTDQTQTQLGLYLQDQMRWDRWYLTLGGREDFTWSTTGNNINKTSVKQTPNKFTWRAGLLYESAIGLSPYFSYSTSFLPTLSTNLAGDPLQPTTGQQYEIGIKYQPVNTNAIFTASLFNLTQQNVSTADPANTRNTIQTGEVRSRGAELEARMSLTSRLNLVASYTYQDVEVTRSNNADLGKRPYGVPRNMASIWADYHFGNVGDVKLGAGAGVRYLGQTAGDSANSFSVPGVTLVDASLHADIGWRWRLQLNATNLFDRTYVAGCNTTVQCYYGTGRTVLGSVTARW
ncbi:TonB-dependent siderophore receptor [Pandoraea bronchicola]|uniref:TonB-dependent siderophore receptor n=1 Tax=Pandoraea bronchicola TaxID=2508287 RepID=A0A5E5BQR1_9BURK|nr:TonB-dependent siderophore receptor [Pandoraea bronchicola]VVE86813.1 TonB-dependent siderophore receptor [Pandoraea bronchicola]